MALLDLKQSYEVREGCDDTGILLMDGDWLVFQAMSAAEFDASWEEEIWHRCCDHAKARQILEDSIKSYETRKKASVGTPIVLSFTTCVTWLKEQVDWRLAL
ncbi:hypothetical protein [Xylella fastidiosa]|uniref:hypothetical protein n=1 Tax=Xylella fastidiosa TaxID=2371 RepID=UPI001EEB025E|nr:hypothetical protein [Xylella fastidiosa]